MMKALILHSGVSGTKYNGVPSAGGIQTLTDTPDYFQGFGRAQLDTVLLLARPGPQSRTLFVDERSLFQLTQYAYPVRVTTTTHILKTTLSWFDPPNPEFAARVLVNDLDLVLISPSKKVYFGNNAKAKISHRDEFNNVSEINISILIVLVL